VKPFIDNALRAAASTDGVLEVRDEHFWTLSDGILVGTFTLRLRWDANEQNVLKEVSHRFEPILSHCTINVARDAWDPTKEAAQGQGAQPLAQPLSMAQLFPAAPPPPMVFNFPLPPPPPLPRQ
jgi:zinc transporter 6